MPVNRLEEKERSMRKIKRVFLVVIILSFALPALFIRAKSSSTCEATISGFSRLASNGDELKSNQELRVMEPGSTVEFDEDGTIFLPFVTAPGVSRQPTGGTWSMAGANPERTSWVAEEIKGRLNPLWYRPIEAFILPRIQIVTAYDTLYISTSKGLYALNAADGSVRWVYPTEMPLGHSPTVHDGIAYVGGFDRKLHAINALTGQGLWTYPAGAGFDTNPLVVDNKVYAGNRDGYFYAIFISGPDQGKLAWRYRTGGSIHFSAAYKDRMVYFASDDSHAYALNADTGQLVWKSDKLPGAGFHSWWPVVYQDWVIFAGSNNYPHRYALEELDEQYVYPNRTIDPRGTLVGRLGKDSGNWVSGTPTINTSIAEVSSNGATNTIIDYLEEKPWRRTYFVLNRQNGQEYTTDFDRDGRPEYAPILWFSTHGTGNRYPPVVGSDGILYQTNSYMSDPDISGGHVSGWQIGTPYISIVSSDWGAVDEPHAYSAGGNLIYWNLCCDRQAGSFDITIPNTLYYDKYTSGILPATGGGLEGNYSPREWTYINYDLQERYPDYSLMTYIGSQYYAPHSNVFGGRNGIYNYHGDNNPPIPYQGKVFMHRSNAVIAFSPDRNEAVSLPVVPVSEPPSTDGSQFSEQDLRSKLAGEVGKVINSGHLRPGFSSAGEFDLYARFGCGDDLVDYWHHPGETLYTLTRALPYLSNDLQQGVRAYLQSEFSNFPPYQYNHIGWSEGAPREIFDLPPEVVADMENSPPRMEINNFEGWSFAPHSFYAMWKYAEVFGGARQLFDASRNKLEAPPSDSYLADMPHVHNAYIAGYMGYLELERAANYPETAQVRQELNRLLALRVTNFSKDIPDSYFEDRTLRYCRTLAVSRNFMYLVPELGQYLRNNALAEIREALDEYQEVAPYWFVSKADVTFAEAVTSPLYNVHAIFQAKAQILNEPQEELAKYLDIPAFPVGDLFYIDNLIATLEAVSGR
jgi:outer membrane protein assembly factor BamB